MNERRVGGQCGRPACALVPCRGGLLAPARRAEADEAALLFVPQGERQATQALPQRDAVHLAQLGIALEALAEAVVRNPAAQVMHVVGADIRREPAHHRRQMEIGAALERGPVEVPRAFRSPVRRLELVLHVEQPDADGPGQQRDRHLHHGEPVEADQETHRDDNQRRQEVAQQDVGQEPPAPAQHVERQPELDDENPGRRDADHNDRVAIAAVAQLPPPGQRRVFADRQRRYIADPARVEIARGRVMDRVRIAPVFVRRERDQSDQPPDHVVGPA